MKDGIVIGLIAAAGAGGALLLLSRRQEADQGGAGYYGGGGGVDTTGGYGNYSFIDPVTGQPIDPTTGLPAGTPGAPGAPGEPGAPGPSSSPYIQLSKPAEDAIIQNTQDTNDRIARDNEATNQALRDSAAQQERDSTLNRNVNIAVGAGLLAASYRGLVNFGKSVVSSAAGLGRTVTPLARAAITAPAAPIVGGALQGGLSIVQGAQDLQARNQGQGPYANIKNDAAAVTAATANTAAATAVGAGSLGLASLDFNRGVHFLGLPVVTTGSKRGKSRLFGQSWLEF